MPHFSRRSTDKLNTCDERLQKICYDVIELMDFSVLDGHRNEEDQNKAYEDGNSDVRWPHSKHNKVPSQAVDIAPYDRGIDFKDFESFNFLATLMFEAAAERGIRIKWGGHFKHPDGSDFYDGGHFELI